MSETNQKSRAYGLGVIGGVSALTGIALQVKPDEAVSNLSLWLQFFGIDRVPSFLATTQADTWGTTIGLSVTALSFLIWAYRRHKSGKAKVGNPEPGRLPQRPSYLAEQQAYREERARQRAIDDAEKIRRKRKDENIIGLIDMFKGLTTKPDEKEIADKEAEQAATFETGFNDALSNRVPFTRIRHDAPQFGLILDDSVPTAQNLAYDIEGAMRQAAVDGKLKVWGRKYRGLINDNDPLVEIPASHFEDYGFMHGCLHYAVANEKTATGTIQMRTWGVKGKEGVTYYDLWISYDDARRVLTQIAKDQSA